MYAFDTPDVQCMLLIPLMESDTDLSKDISDNQGTH